MANTLKQGNVMTKWRAWALALAFVLAASPASAQTLDEVITLLDEWTEVLHGDAAMFFLLVGLVVAWLIAWRNTLAGLVVGGMVLVLAAMVGNYEDIGSTLGLG